MKDLLFRMEELVNEIRQSDESILEHFQKFLDIWAETTKCLVGLINKPKVKLCGSQSFYYYLKFGENKVYIDHSYYAKKRVPTIKGGEEVDIREIPLGSLKAGIQELFERTIKDLVAELENKKEVNDRILNLLKGVFLAYEAERTKKAVTSKTSKTKRLSRALRI